MIGLDNYYEVMKALLKAYGISMPEVDEDEDPNQKSGANEKLNIARIVYIGMTKLYYTESGVLDMTPRKFYRMYDEYLIMNGLKKEIDSAIDALP